MTVSGLAPVEFFKNLIFIGFTNPPSGIRNLDSGFPMLLFPSNTYSVTSLFYGIFKDIF